MIIMGTRPPCSTDSVSLRCYLYVVQERDGKPLVKARSLTLSVKFT